MWLQYSSYSLAKISEDGEEISGSGRPRYESWRRYSEFENLHNFLQAVYPHVSECYRHKYSIFWY